ncbi:WG repeat-containing protein [Candidatus Odyssella thessalonicensis]|uniref:WG repeat-containing protein n=1 Tax=Candidatus Odyssella thessalonicensis TaxID=84647 RepID=UPI000225B1ED|nr:WG repeat-containing protein [Candidatus Odyssella thessalonicensis]
MTSYCSAIVMLFAASLSFAHATQKLIPYKDARTGLYGLKTPKGKRIIPAQFQRVTESGADETLIPVIKDGTYYRMDLNGNLKFESVFYDNGWDYYEEGLARFLKDGKVGFHDKKGNIVIPPSYDFAKYFEKGVAIVCNGCWAYYPQSPKWRPLSSGHNITIQEAYLDITGGKWGAINLKGEIVVPIECTTAEEVAEKLKPQG